MIDFNRRWWILAGALVMAGCSTVQPDRPITAGDISKQPVLIAKAPTAHVDAFAGLRSRVLDGQGYTCELRWLRVDGRSGRYEVCFTAEQYRQLVVAGLPHGQVWPERRGLWSNQDYTVNAVLVAAGENYPPR